MKTISDLREDFGAVYIIELSDGQIVPFRLLTIQEYIKYDEDFKRGLIAIPSLEEELFRLCVKNSFLIENINLQKAGTISSVVSQIMQQSGPRSTEEFNSHLNFSRNKLNNNIFHQMTSLICTAFPAYKPEDVEALTYETFILRLVQAEVTLLRTGYLEQPLALINNAEEITEKPRKIENTQLKQAFEQQQLRQQAEQKVPQSQRRVREDLTHYPKEKVQDGRVIISKEELRTKTFSGADLEDADLFEHAMLTEAVDIYKDYLEDVKAGKKVIIKSPEEKLKERRMKSKTRNSKLSKK